MDKSIFANIVAGCYQNRNTSQTFFVGKISPPKIPTNCSWWSQLDRTIVYSPELYWTPSQMISYGSFEIAAPKYLENCQKNVCGGVPFRVARINSTAYYRTAPQTHSGSAQKTSKKFFVKLSLFFLTLLTLQPCNPKFLTSANAVSKKKISFECSEIVRSLPEKGL